MFKMKNITFFRRVLRTVWKERKSFSFISHIHRIYQDFDDPQTFQYSSSVNANEIDTDGFKEITICTGSSIHSEEEALGKCLIEALERKASLTYKNSNFIYSSYSKLVDLKKIAINPLLFSPFSQEQLCQEKYKRFNINKSSIIPWMEADNLTCNKKMMIPAELIYFNFMTDTKIAIPISTGTAAGSTRDDAILRGIYEVIERDAFMLRYLSQTTGKEILPKNSGELKVIHEICTNYRLQARFIDITVDMPIPTVLAILTNVTNVGPSVSLGLKTHPDYKEGILGSFMEALQTRTWLRHHCEDHAQKDINKNDVIHTFEERGSYWYNKNMLPHLSFFIEKIKKIDMKQDKKSTLTLVEILELLKDKGYEVFVVDLTPKEYASIPLSVVKVIIPGFQSLYLDEEFPYLGGKRLNNITHKFNTIPHPFL